MVVKIPIIQEDKNKAMEIALKRSEVDKRNHKKDNCLDTRRSSLETTLIGTLAEVVVERTFELVCDAPWVIYNPKKRFGFDFKNHEGKSIELKSTDKFYKPYVQVNVEFYNRKKREGLLPDYFLFVQFEGKFNHASHISVLGYMPSSMIPKFPIDPMGTDTQPSFHIEKNSLINPYGHVLTWKKGNKPTK